MIKKIREAIGPLLNSAKDGSLKNPNVRAMKSGSLAVSRQTSAEPEIKDREGQDATEPSPGPVHEEDLSE